MVITPGFMDIYESISLCLWWALYIAMVYRTDILAKKCCCCLAQKHVDKILKSIESQEPTAAEKSAQRSIKTVSNAYVQLGDIDEDLDDDEVEESRSMSYVKQHSIIKRDRSGKFGVLYDERGHPITQNVPSASELDNIHVVPGAIGDESVDEDLQNLLEFNTLSLSLCVSIDGAI